MPTTITSAGITFNDTTSLTSANIGTAQLANGAVTAVKLGTTEQKQIAKAWVNFNGTTSPGTIRSSYNVSSVTKNAVGDYTVNFATAMADANYSACLSRSGGNNGVGIVDNSGVRTKTTSAYNFVLINNAVSSLVDEAYISVQIFGN